MRTEPIAAPPSDQDAGDLPECDVGPVLYMRGYGGDRLQLAALIVRPAARGVPELMADGEAVGGTTLLERYGLVAARYDFDLPASSAASYRLDGERYAVNADFSGDLRIAYVSCNGQEHRDRQRALAERNVLWERLEAQHGTRPFHLLLHGGDQLYADEIVRLHPAVKAWARAHGHGRDAAVDPASVHEVLGRALFQRYLELLGQPAFASVLARVPSLAMWDDHDICDGWGSLPEAQLDSTIGRALFAVAREHFLLFQLGARPDELPEICRDHSGRSLGWHLELPRLHVVAPDLRSERRPDRVMGEVGWAMLEEAWAAVQGGRVVVLSSVPALGPRLSWLEAVMHLLPAMQKYEDDLRDQWQSRAHRDEWRTFLKHLLMLHERDDISVTVLSGEIHLATRGTLASLHGPLHQLVSSGIAHPPPPRSYALALGALASLGAAPLADHPIGLEPLPGRPTIYTAERNYLVLERLGDDWHAVWELEESGATPPLSLD